MTQLKPKLPVLLSAFLLLPAAAFAAPADTMVHQMMILVFQLTLILFAAKYAGKLFRRLRLPAVIGELFAGIIIGPYLLGSIPLPGLPHGLFGHFLASNPAASLPVSPELYAFSVVASVLLLFMVGLETDIDLFLRFTVPSLVIGGAGVAASFFAGAGMATFFPEGPLHASSGAFPRGDQHCHLRGDHRPYPFSPQKDQLPRRGYDTRQRGH
ncbi:MAG: cation:proton antiporter [Candidatus Marinimicrobia bacterium]|nr:cation:proton antiporter [Candidatus Neomarinimicrobiota bacterium]